MDTSKERLKEIARQLRSAPTGALGASLRQEEIFINQMIALEQRIAATERDLVSARGIRTSAYRMLHTDKSTTEQFERAMQNALIMVEASVEKTVELSVKLSMLKNDKDSLISKRAAERMNAH
jgi:hypothetical protein